MRRCILVCLLASVPSVGIAAWTNIGPFGGRVPSIATDSSGTNVFVLNPRSGVFRSTGGGPWTLVFDAAARGVIGSRVAVDSQNGRVYAGTSGGLFRSDDNGATWRLLINDPIFAVAAAGDRVVASAASALERSGDAGVTWKSLDSPGSDAGNTVLRVLFDVRTDRVVVVNEGAVFVSDNFGTS